MANLKEAVEAGLSALDGLYDEQADAPLTESYGQWRLAMSEASAALRLMKSALEAYNTNEVDNPEIVLAYLEGKEIEYQDNYSKQWRSYHFPGVTHPIIGHPSYHWRVKSEIEIMKYRVGLFQRGDLRWTISVTNPGDCRTYEEIPDFARWLTNWIEVEV